MSLGPNWHVWLYALVPRNDTLWLSLQSTSHG